MAFLKKIMAPRFLMKHSVETPIAGSTLTSRQVYQRILEYFRPYWKRSITALLLTLPIGALDAAVAFSLKPYVDAMLVQKSVQTISIVPFVVVVFTFFQGVLNYFSIYLNGWLGNKVMSDIRHDLFKKLQTLDVAFFDTTPSGTIIQRFFQDPLSINSNILTNTKQMLTRIFSSLSLMILLISISWKLSIVAIGILLLVLYPSTQIRKVIKRLAHQNMQTSSELLSFYNESITGIRVTYGFNLPKLRLRLFDTIQKDLFRNAIKSTQAQGWLAPSMHTISAVGIALIIWQGSLMVVKGEFSPGSFVSFLASMILLYNPIKNLGGSIMNAQIALLSAARVFELMDYTPTITDSPDAITLTEIKDGISFQNVCFHYTPEKPVLKNVSMTFEKGKTVAIVGSSGSGKSTIASLIPRFYDVVSGSIQIDGVDIRHLSLDSLRKHIAMVMQDTFLFDGSIRDNLLFGNPDATDAMIDKALEQSYLTEFLATLPEGMDTRIGERGVMLSGGQRQRLAIARAMIKNAAIVILDEATSALDNKSEAVVQKAMEALMENRTVIVIAHRLSTIRKADRIVVLEEGHVMESGTHEELMNNKASYSHLYHAQFTHSQLETFPA
jgi:ATP-binding cassette, subfamily B, bacterial MsbA